MNKQRKLTRKEKIKLAKQETIKQHPSSYLNVSHLQNVKHLWFLAGVIVLVTFITFSPALKNDFTNWDDNLYVSENKALAKPIMEAIRYFFGPHYFVGNYSPVTMITYALEYHLFGVKPEIYHLVNLAIHLLNVLMVFWFIYLLSGKKIEVAAIVSLLFGIHPLHVESVAWIAELKDVLYTFFFMGGLITYYKYLLKTQDIRHKTQDGGLRSEVRSKKSDIRLHYFLTFILFVISALCKPAAVTFPIVLLLIDYYTKRYKTQDTRYKIWIEKIPLFIVSFILGIVVIKIHQHSHFVDESYTVFQRLLFTSYSIVDYIIKLFLPINLSNVYPYPQLIEGHLPYIFYITPFIVLLLFYGIYMTFKYSNINVSHLQNMKHLILFGFLFFFVNIALVLQILTVGNSIMADRYTYIPYIGLFFIIAMGFTGSWKLEARSWKKVSGMIVIILYSLFFIHCSYARCRIWKNSETLWTDALNKFPDNPIALYNKGVILYAKGQNKEAMNLFSHAIQLNPNYSDAYINLANCYYAMHDYNNALKNIDIGLKYPPPNPIAINSKGAILYKQGKYKEAMALFKTAIKLNPQYGEAYMNIGSCYGMLEDFDNAILYWKKSLEFNPDNIATYKILGWAYQKKGDRVSADAYFAKAKNNE